MLIFGSSYDKGIYKILSVFTKQIPSLLFFLTIYPLFYSGPPCACLKLLSSPDLEVARAAHVIKYSPMSYE